MLPERAEEMLKDYKACYGRCGYLREALEALRMDEKAMMAEHRDDLITGTAKPPDGMPHGTTVGNPTERIAFMLLCRHITQDISDIRKEIREMEEEYAEKRLVVVFVEAWLSGLAAKERWMIERCYFDGMTYREINARYREEYGEGCSKDLLRRLKKDALAKIYKMAE